MDGATMDDGQMTNTYTITNDGACLFVCAMDNCPILNIDFISNSDGIYVAPDDRIEPDGTPVSHHNIAHDGGIWRDKTFISKDWRNSVNG
jgi:hypothetical protein